MPELIEVRFKGNRKDVYTWDATAARAVGDAVVVEADRGLDSGIVAGGGEAAGEEGAGHPRRAGRADQDDPRDVPDRGGVRAGPA